MNEYNQWLLKLAETLEHADRLGKEEDHPEGSRYIMITDTLAVEIAIKLREIASNMTKERIV